MEISSLTKIKHDLLACKNKCEDLILQANKLFTEHYFLEATDNHKTPLHKEKIIKLILKIEKEFLERAEETGMEIANEITISRYR